MLERVRLYVLRRAARRGRLSLLHARSRGGDFTSALMNNLHLECEALLAGIEEIAPCPDIAHNVVMCVENSDFVNLRGAYSTNVRIDPHALSRGGALFTLRQGDAVQFLLAHKEHYDVILTDPPYGVNHQADLGSLYLRFIPAALEAMSSGGQFILVLPVRSFNGQEIPPLIRPSFMSQFVLMEADRLGIPLQVSHEWPQFFEKAFAGRIYWRSARVLRREVLCFKRGT